MTVDLVIVGAGGGSRELASVVLDQCDASPTCRLLGFLDDDPKKQGTEVVGFPVLGPLERARELSGALFVIGIARSDDPEVRRTIHERLRLPRDRYASVIHPRASFSRHTRIGVGTSVQAHAVSTANATIGDHVFVSAQVTITHDVTIEDFATIAAGSVLLGGVHLESGCYVGGHAVVKPGVRIGRGALVGMGAVVLRDVPPGAVVYGNPARMRPASDHRSGGP